MWTLPPSVRPLRPGRRDHDRPVLTGARSALVAGALALAALASACGDEAAESVTVETIESEIFTPTCATAGCHRPPVNAGSLDLSAPVRAKIVGVQSSQFAKPLVTPGDLGNSYLYDKVNRMMLADGTDPMPPPPAPPLDARRLGLLETWIENGAP